MRLRARFTLLAVLMAEGTLAAALGLQRVLESRHLEGLRWDAHAESARKLARVGQDALVDRNDLIALKYVRELKASPETRYAALVDAEGAVRVDSRMLEGMDTAGSRWGGPAAAAEGPRWTDREDGSRDLALPVVVAGRRIGEVHLGVDRKALRAAVRRDLRGSLVGQAWIALGSTLLALAGAAWLARALRTGLDDLHAGAARVAAGDFASRVDERRADELGDLARAFNRMAGEIERLDRVREAVVASITHDLRSPLQAIRSNAELSLGDAPPSPEEARESAQVIHDNASRLFVMADDLTDLLKLNMGRLEVSRQALRPGEALEAARRLMAASAGRVGVRLEVELPGPVPPVEADPALVHRVLVNLVANALKFTPAGGWVSLRADSAAHHVSFQVADSGRGMPAAKLASLFEASPFEPGATPGKSTAGLGLAICKRLVEAHGGRIRADSLPGRGTRVFFTLPLESPPCSAACSS